MTAAPLTNTRSPVSQECPKTGTKPVDKTTQTGHPQRTELHLLDALEQQSTIHPLAGHVAREVRNQEDLGTELGVVPASPYWANSARAASKISPRKPFDLLVLLFAIALAWAHLGPPAGSLPFAASCAKAATTAFTP